MKNAVVNSVARGAPDVDEQARFFRLVDEYSTAHLRLLTFIANTNKLFTLIDDGRGTPIASGRLEEQVEETIPEFAGRSDWCQLLLIDLADARLVTTAFSLEGASIDVVLRELGTTRLDLRFLRFISEAPKDANAG